MIPKTKPIAGSRGGGGGGGSPVRHVVRDRADVFGIENSRRPRWSIYGMPKDKFFKPVKGGPQGRLGIVRGHILQRKRGTSGSSDAEKRDLAGGDVFVGRVTDRPPMTCWG